MADEEVDVVEHHNLNTDETANEIINNVNNDMVMITEANTVNIDQSNLIINYLPSSFDEDKLKELFSGFGHIESVKIVKDRSSNRTLGYGFVKFSQVRDAVIATQRLNGYLVDNKRLKVSYARLASLDLRNCKLYITNIPLNFTEENLTNSFQRFGEIIECRLVKDPGTSASKGVGFIQFNVRTQAEDAVNNMDGTVLPGGTRPLNVKYAEDQYRKKEIGRLHQQLFDSNVTLPQTTTRTQQPVPSAATQLPVPRGEQFSQQQQLLLQQQLLQQQIIQQQQLLQLQQQQQQQQQQVALPISVLPSPLLQQPQPLYVPVSTLPQQMALPLQPQYGFQQQLQLQQQYHTSISPQLIGINYTNTPISQNWGNVYNGQPLQQLPYQPAPIVANNNHHPYVPTTIGGYVNNNIQTINHRQGRYQRHYNDYNPQTNYNYYNNSQYIQQQLFSSRENNNNILSITLYVSNVPMNFDENRIYDFFSYYGRVIHVTLLLQNPIRNLDMRNDDEESDATTTTAADTTIISTTPTTPTIPITTAVNVNRKAYNITMDVYEGVIETIYSLNYLSFIDGNQPLQIIILNGVPEHILIAIGAMVREESGDQDQQTIDHP